MLSTTNKIEQQQKETIQIIPLHDRKQNDFAHVQRSDQYSKKMFEKGNQGSIQLDSLRSNLHSHSRAESLGSLDGLKSVQLQLL